MGIILKIMTRKSNITFSRFLNLNEIDISNLFERFQSIPYQEKYGFGYTNSEIDNNVIYATLIKRNMTTLLEYDLEKKDFKKVEIPLFDEIIFCIDFNKSLLYTFGATANHNKIKSALRNTSDLSFTYGDFSFSPVTFMDKIISQNLNYNIDEIVVNNFIYKNGTSGKYIAKIILQNVGIDLLETYQNDIVKISITIFEKNNYHLVISLNNTISIKCHDDDFYSILENIKNMIYG